MLWRLLVILLVPSLCFGSTAGKIRSNTKAVSEYRVQAKKTALLTWLTALPSLGTNKVLSGQMSWTNTTIDGVYSAYGKYPALRGLDWLDNPDPQLSIDAIQWSKNNGIVTMMYHMPNPFVGNARYTNLTNGNWTNLITESTTENTNWKVTLDEMATTLKRLQDSHVVVLFRPFHEMTGYWFWWGTQNATSAEFMAAWQYLYNYMTETKGLKNLLWVYSAYPFAGYMNAYPGNSYVDITGLSIYDAPGYSYQSIVNDFNALGKPFAVTEYGKCASACPSGGADASAILPTDLPSSTIFWMSWESGYNGYWGLDQPNAGTATIFSNSAVRTLDEMPAF